MPKIKSKVKGQRSKASVVTLPAFTLIEVLLSMFFMIAMVTILLSSSGTLLQTRTSNLQTTATKIATRKIENLRNTAFTSLPIGTNSFADSDLSQLPQGTATSTITDYSIQPDPPDPNIKNVLITISYTENGAPREVKLETLIYKNGL